MPYLTFVEVQVTKCHDVTTASGKEVEVNSIIYGQDRVDRMWCVQPSRLNPMNADTTKFVEEHGPNG